MVSTHDVTVSDSVVVKRFRSYDRAEPDREWRALHILSEHAPGLAPVPISFAPPVITMSRLSGRELSGALRPAELTALGESIDRMFSVPAVAIPPSVVLSHPAVHVARVRGMMPARVDDVDPVVRTAIRAGRSWLSGPDPDDLISGEAPPVFARGDYNLANFLYDGQSVCVLDFEDSGRGDRGVELGQLVEHISARETADPAWLALCDGFELRPVERRRFIASRRIEAIFWLAMLVPGGPAAERNPPETLAQQANRVLALL